MGSDPTEGTKYKTIKINQKINFVKFDDIQLIPK